MNRRYEALLALDTRGKEDTAKDTIERLEKLLAAPKAPPSKPSSASKNANSPTPTTT